MRLQNDTTSATTLHATLIQPFTLTASVAPTQGAIIIWAFVETLLYQLCVCSADMSRNDFPTMIAFLLGMTSMIAASAIDQILQTSVSLLTASLKSAFERIHDLRINEAIHTQREIHDNDHRQRRKMLFRKLTRALDYVLPCCPDPWLQLETTERYTFQAGRNIDRAVSILDALGVDEKSTNRPGTMKYWLLKVSEFIACHNYGATSETDKQLSGILEPVIEAFLSESFHDEVLQSDIVLRDLTYGVLVGEEQAEKHSPN
ncbi:hypothetical protein LTS10_005059 [Elasticomyces elasticus]|nr:hypothetical protein LTS10_005059 [Elasticomyces elasticus]